MLGIALTNAVSGLKVNQQSLAAISQNIANVNNKDYSRQIVNQESVNLGSMVGSGVRISEITRSVDEFISRAVVYRGADVARSRTISEYYKQAELYYGQPGSGNSIDTYIDNFFNSLNTLQSNPKNASIKQNSVAAAEAVASEIAGLARNIEELRFQADRGISESINNINFHISQIKDLNRAILSAQYNNVSVNSLMDKAQASLKAISEEIDINYTYNSDNTINITTAGGYTLISDSNTYEIVYKPSSSAEQFYGDLSLEAIEIYSISLDGERSQFPSVEIASAGYEDSIVTSITGGKIKGYMEVRDKLLPDMLRQLDNLAADLRNEINAIHNKGSAYPPVRTLTGQTLIDPTQPHAWDGSVMIAALNADGSALASPYPSEAGKGMPPLTLNLGNLEDGNGLGRPTYQTIIDEINYYYGAPQNRLNIGPISNITLASKSSALDGNSGTFDFDLEFTNYSEQAADIVITGVTVNNGAAVTTPSSFPTSSSSISNGAKERAFDFTLDMSSGTNTNYNVEVAVQVTDADGNVYTDTITYSISEATSDLMNRRYVAQSVSGSGDAAIEAPTSTNNLLHAKLVDANGNEINKDPVTGNYLSAGYLLIQGSSENNKVAISELDSADKGDYATGAAATNIGFSHFLGLNNFFDGGTTVNGAALALSVREDIKTNPSLMSMAELYRSETDNSKEDYSYEIGESSSTITEKMVTLNLENRTFESAGPLPQIVVTFSGYATQILGYAASVTALAESEYYQDELIHAGFVEKENNIRGVNIDEEMANTIIFQNAYAASARVISAVDEMFESLINSF